MTSMTLAGRSFGAADYGVTWALFQLPEPSVRDNRFYSAGRLIELLPLPKAAGQDDYAVKFSRGALRVLSNTAAGTIYGLLRLARELAEGRRKDLAQHIVFRTRNYKHETKLDVRNPRAVVKYTDDTWEALFRRMVAHQFNAVVFYAGTHPFEYFLEFGEFSKYIPHSADERAAVRKALSRGLAIAHRYGLRTYLQHYVAHYPQAMAEEYKIPLVSRLADVDHPAVDRYCRYCYRETFNQLPDLDAMMFNYESAGSNWQHVLRNAVAEFNRLKVKPIMWHRGWEFVDMAGAKKLMRAYKGHTIISHKIPETNDTYYLPVADSRVREWKKALGKNLEFAYMIGPCHNCGTNICDQLWGDYKFVRDMLADAKKKGADSISFNTINEFFSPDMPDPAHAFGDHEKNMARFNVMHVQAAVDFFNGRAMKPADQAAAMASRAGAAAKAGAALREAVEASSQLALLVNQQFCSGSSHDGYLHRGRYSHVQEPFFHYPATELNHQAKLWGGGRTEWVDKVVDAKVAPDNFLQYIIDYVNPRKPKAVRNPQKLADLLKANIDKSFKALATYRKLAGEQAAAALEPYIKQNALFGQYVRHEILSAIDMYSIYFARTKPAVVAALNKGLAQLKAAALMQPPKDSPECRIMNRVALLPDGLSPYPEINEAVELLDLLEKTDFPMPAFVAYVESRRQFNEIRRILRPLRERNAQRMKFAAGQFKKAIAAARKSLALLKGDKYAALARNVGNWLAYLERELKRTKSPQATVGSQAGVEFMPLYHEDCFRQGENYIQDFSGFFKWVNYLRPAKIGIQVYHTAKELVVTLREQGVDMVERKETWLRDMHRPHNNATCMKIDVDTKARGSDIREFIVWPMGRGVNAGREPMVDARSEFSYDDHSWQMTVHLPYNLIGRRPRKGEVWGLNVRSNPYNMRNHAYTWAPQYDSFSPALFGKIKFA